VGDFNGEAAQLLAQSNPELFDKIMNSGRDPQEVARELLQDFQLGIGAGAIIDREAAKERIRRILFGQEEMKNLVDEQGFFWWGWHRHYDVFTDSKKGHNPNRAKWGENIFPLFNPSFTWRGFKRTSLTVVANNVLDHRPPANGYSVRGYDSSTYGAAASGRTLSLRVRRDF